MQAFIKLMRDSPQIEYLLRRPNAWALLTQIALRARRETGIDPRTGIHLEAGEALIGDYKSLGLTEKAYRVAKKQLSEAGITAYRRANRGTIAKIVNTDTYDVNITSGGDPRCDQKGRPRGDQRGVKQEFKNEKKEKHIAGFDEFWAAYPKRQAKASAERVWSKLNPDAALRETILEALEIHKQTEQWQQRQFVPLPATWLNQRRWEDELSTDTNEHAPKSDPEAGRRAEAMAEEILGHG